jgi:hypothetical protein
MIIRIKKLIDEVLRDKGIVATQIYLGHKEIMELREEMRAIQMAGHENRINGIVIFGCEVHEVLEYSYLYAG